MAGKYDRFSELEKRIAALEQQVKELEDVVLQKVTIPFPALAQPAEPKTIVHYGINDPNPPPRPWNIGTHDGPFDYSMG